MAQRDIVDNSSPGKYNVAGFTKKYWEEMYGYYNVKCQ